MPGQLGSATINAVNNKRHTLAFQEPLGATTGFIDPSLVNGTIGGGFNAIDSVALFPITNPGYAVNGTPGAVAAAQYVVADVDAPAGTVTVVAGHITVAGAGGHVLHLPIVAGEYAWVYAD